MTVRIKVNLERGSKAFFMNTLRTIIAVGLAGASTLVLADAPTTRPVLINGATTRTARLTGGPTTAPTRSDALQQFRARNAGWREAVNGVDPSSQQAPSAEEWQKIAAFSQENFPNRWNVFEKIEKSRGDDSDVVKAIKMKIALKYRGLMKAQDDMPDVYSAALQQNKLEDDAWGTLLQVRRDPNNDALRAELREKVGVLVNAILQERADRLELLQTVVEQQQQQLDDARQNTDRLIDRQMSHLLSDNPFGGSGMSGPGFGGGHRRFGPGGRDGDRQAPNQSNTDQPNADQVGNTTADKPAANQ